jgi:hypothetical protein
MVPVAQLVEHWIVIPVVAGSNPVGHPNLLQNSVYGIQYSVGFRFYIVMLRLKHSPYL